MYGRCSKLILAAVLPVVLTACVHVSSFVRYDGERFTVYAGESLDLAPILAGEAEKIVADIAGALSVPVPTASLDVYLFPNGLGMMNYLAVKCPKQAMSAAACFATEEGFTVTVVDRGTRSKTMEHLRHELTHYVLASNYVDFPPWIDEGLAQHFQREDPAAPIGDKVRRYLAGRVRRMGGRDTEKIIAVPYGGSLSMGQYSRSRAMVHFLMSSDEYGSAEVNCYLRETINDDRPIDHFRVCFDASPDEFVRNMRRFYGM